MPYTHRPDYSFKRGLRVSGRGIVTMARTNLPVFIWVNFFSIWFVGGAILMLARGSTSVLPVVFLLTPFVSLTWFILLNSKYGFSRLGGMPRAVPWLAGMALAIHEFATGNYEGQPEGYYTFLAGFLIINGIATAIDAVDVVRWLRGERMEQFETGFFEEPDAARSGDIRHEDRRAAASWRVSPERAAAGSGE